MDSGFSDHQSDRNKEPNLMDPALNEDPVINLNQGEHKVPEQVVGSVAPSTLNPMGPHQASQDADTSTSLVEHNVNRQSPKLPLTKDLLWHFGLQPLVATVARTDPVTGEKINKLRKSYENHLKIFGLAGRNKGVKGEHPNRLLQLAQWPDEEYYNQHVLGKDLMQGLPAATLQKLDKAMQMQPGAVPDNHKWEDLLGHEKSKPQGVVIDKTTKASGTIAQPNGGTTIFRGNAVRAAETEDSRPVRAGKRRRYNDNSFEGYAEGFEDDDADVPIGDGYSSEEHSRKGGSFKRRKKGSRDFGSSNPA